MDAYERGSAVGAHPVAGGTRFRVWAPGKPSIEVAFFDSPGIDLRRPPDPSRTVPLLADDDGYHAATVDAGAGALYGFRLGPDGDVLPDPASRFQPAGPFGPSEVVDVSSFPWTDAAWRGLAPHEHVVYELHIGTFTPEGSWAAAERHLGDLAELGVTTIEVMPVADFAGRFGWGYDGVDLFAPTRLYGRPEDMARFVDAAHGHGLAVVLDVVYNHAGPAGSFLERFTSDYFTDRYDNEWGRPFNFDGPNAGPVRAFFQHNTAYWIRDFHLDGLRFDATQSMFDASEEHIVAVIARAARDAAPGRTLFLVAENEPQDARLLRSPADGGFGLDAAWNDDFHHTAIVAATGRREAYYCDYGGTPQELVSSIKRGYLYQGQHYVWQSKSRGSPALDIAPRRFVHYLDNHDQVANTLRGERLHQRTSPGRLRALTALLVLSPPVPMLFQGQEFAASSPFVFFADHEPDLAETVVAGRTEHLRQFPSSARAIDTSGAAPDPADPTTFARCRLDQRERKEHAATVDLHHDLLALRRGDAVLSRANVVVDGAVLGPEAFVVRFFAPDGDRVLIVNLGRDIRLSPLPEPLLAPPAGRRWEVLWTSEDVRYGGAGTPPMTPADWVVPAETALLLVGEAAAADRSRR